MSLPNLIKRWVEVQQGTFDLGGYLDLFSDDVDFYDAASARDVHGKQELSEFVRPFTQLSDVSATVLGYAVNEKRIFVEGELRATAPTGQPVLSRGVGVFNVEGSKISSFAMYMFRQNIGT